MLQASVCDGVALDALALCEDTYRPLDEGIDLPFEMAAAAKLCGGA